MRLKRILVFGVLIILALGNGLSAQTTSASDSLKKQRKRSARLQLPDEIIYGQNKSTRIIKKSKEPASSEAALLAPDLAALFSAKNFAESKSVFSPSKITANSKKSFQAHWGRFQDTDFQGVWAQQTSALNFRLGGRFQRIGGQYKNSQFQRTSFDADVSGNLTADLSAALSFNGDWRNYGLFQARQAETAGRDFQQLGTDLFVHYFNEKGHSLNGRIFYRGNNFQDVNAEKITQQDRWFGLNFDYGKKISSLFLSVSGNYQHNEFGEDQQQSILESGVNFGFAPLNFLCVNAGVLYQDIGVSEQKSRTKLSPKFELILTPLQNLGAKISFGREIVPIVFDQWFSINPYIDFSADLLPIEKQLQVDAEFEYLASENFRVLANFKTEKSANDVYWIKNYQTGLFVLNRLESTAVTKFSLGAAWELLPKMQLDGKFTATFYSLGDDSLSGVDAHFPYAENFCVPLSLNWKFARSWNFALGMNWVGSRYIALRGEEKLPSFLWLNAKFEKNIFSRYSLFLQGKNLLNQSVEIWQGFPERGASLLAGVRAEW